MNDNSSYRGILFIFLNSISFTLYFDLLFFFLMIRRPPRSTLFPTRRSSDLAAERIEVRGIAISRGIGRHKCARRRVVPPRARVDHAASGVVEWKSVEIEEQLRLRGLAGSHVETRHAIEVFRSTLVVRDGAEERRELVKALA